MKNQYTVQILFETFDTRDEAEDALNIYSYYDDTIDKYILDDGDKYYYDSMMELYDDNIKTWISTGGLS